MKVVAIIMKDDTDYTVGVIPADIEAAATGIDGFDGRVSKINFHREGAYYNRGFQTGEPGYSVIIADSTIERLIPLREVKRIHVDNPPKEKEEKVIPELSDS